MRRDVKLGIVLSMLFVLAFGGYYVLRDQRTEPIAVQGTLAKDASGKDNAADKSPAGSPTKPAPTNRNAANQPRRNTEAQPRPTTNNPQNPTINNNTDSRTAANSPTRTVPPSQTNPTVTPESTSTSPLAGAGDSRTAVRPDAAPATGSPVVSQPNRPMSVPADKHGTPSNPTILTNGTASPNSPAEASKGLANVPSTTETNSTEKTIVPDAQRLAGRPAAKPGMSSPLPAGAAPQRTTGLSPAEAKLDTTRNTSNAAVETHRVQPGDTLASISQSYYGSERYLAFLIQANPEITDPGRLSLGALVKIPPQPGKVENAAGGSAPNATRTAAASSSRTYRVRHGDSFYAIARDVLGDASRWQELLAINSDLVKGDPTRLRIGQTVVLPES